MDLFGVSKSIFDNPEHSSSPPVRLGGASFLLFYSSSFLLGVFWEDFTAVFTSFLLDSDVLF